MHYHKYGLPIILSHSWSNNGSRWRNALANRLAVLIADQEPYRDHYKYILDYSKHWGNCNDIFNYHIDL